MRRSVPFEEYVERGLAVHIAPYDYSFRELVLAVAQQIGSGHEDSAVDVPLVQMANMSIGNQGSLSPYQFSLPTLSLRWGRCS